MPCLAYYKGTQEAQEAQVAAWEQLLVPLVLLVFLLLCPATRELSNSRNRFLDVLQRIRVAEAEKSVALLAECGDALGEARIRQALGVDQLGDELVDQRLVLGVELRCATGADRLQRRRRDAAFDREWRMGMPFVIRPDMARREADRAAACGFPQQRLARAVSLRVAEEVPAIMNISRAISSMPGPTASW